MKQTRTKRFSPEGWKYVNADGSLWPEDEWIRYSAKHPAPLTASRQAAKDPNLLKDPTPSPWNSRPEPSAPRAQVPVDQWNGMEEGSTYLVRMTVCKKLPEPDALSGGMVQLRIDQFLAKRELPVKTGPSVDAYFDSAKYTYSDEDFVEE